MNFLIVAIQWGRGCDAAGVLHSAQHSGTYHWGHPQNFVVGLPSLESLISIPGTLFFPGIDIELFLIFHFMNGT